MRLMTRRSSKGVFTALLLVMMLLLTAVPAFALDAPTSRTPLSTPSEVTSITIGGVTAGYWQDDNGTAKFIRAVLNPGSTEYDLKHATVVVNLVSAGTAVSSSTPGLTFSGSGTTTRTATNVDLVNKAYNVTIGSNSYILAAGLPDGSVGIAALDPLAVGVTFSGQSAAANVYGFNQQNPYMGNPYYTDGWTFVNYFIKDALSSTPGDRSDVAGTVTTSATIAGDATQISGSSYSFDLSQAVPSITASAGGDIRLYRLFVSDPTTVEVDYLFDFTELGEDIYNENFPYYENNGPELRAKADQIQTAINEYTGGEPITVASGTTVMDILLDFTDWANGDNPLSIDYFPYPTSNSGTYLSSLNGLGEFDGGALSGWMYTDVPYTLDCSVPWVGAADYALTADGNITWFYTTDYFNHF